MKNRRKFSPEFKQEVVEPARRTGTSVSQIARKPGIFQTSLSRRLKKSQGAAGTPLSFPVQEENRRLRKEAD